jgi:chemotaxis protein CheX
MSNPSNERFLTFSKPFIDAIKNVFTTMVFSDLTPQAPQLRPPGEKAKGDISIVMGLNGNIKVGEILQPFKGMMVLSFATPVYLKVSGAMLMGEFKEYNEEIRDVGAEISNITTGNAKKVLRNMGYLIDMSIPSTVVGSNHEIQYPGNTQTVVIPFDSNHGTFVMEICYQDVDKKA